MTKQKTQTLPMPMARPTDAREAAGAPRVPADQPVRDRLLSEFDRNFLVEAGAGSGKTYSLAMRMAAGVAAGRYSVDGLVAVTFTRKAAAELRGRFQIALEDRLRRQHDPSARARLEAALAAIERLFAGTIHAFCSHLLRERPVDARIAPGFIDLDDVQNVRMQRESWRDYIVQARAAGYQPLLDLLEAGVLPKDLDAAFATVCEHEDIDFDMGSGEPPAAKPVWKAVDTFWRELKRLRPPEFHPDTTCAAQKKFEEFDGRLRLARRDRTSSLAGLLTFWGKPKITQKYWGKEVGRDQAIGAEARDLVEGFHAEVVEPFLQEWRAYVHRLAMAVLIDAREFFVRERRRQNAVNYVDLLRVTAAMLRKNPDVRRSLQRKYRWLFVDEFQDTDPLQAEIFLMLAADEGAVDEDSSEGRDTRGKGCDPFMLPLRPGALFVVGDPKQSIFRFRRADIDIYNRVAVRIRETGGEVVSLTANYRSLPSVCDLANTVFPELFGLWSLPYSPAFEVLDAVRPDDQGGAGPRVTTMTVSEACEDASLQDDEAARIADYIRSEVSAGRRGYGDFLILAQQKKGLASYARALDDREVPVEVSGAGLFCKSPEVRVLASVLAALADPLDSVSLVGVLRGPLFGLSDPELFQFRQAGGRFDLTAPLPGLDDGATPAELHRTFGPALDPMRRLQDMFQLTRRLPLASAVERILEATGWAALAATTPGGATAGYLLQAIDRVRQVAEEGGGLAAAASALDDEEESSESEVLPLEPGRRDVVRLMNLHKAKGLEAPVVFLADPAHGLGGRSNLRIVRSGVSATGVLRIVASRAQQWSPPVLGEPLDWPVHEAEERKYRDAEKLRLLYVASTRARDLLVVGRVATPNKNKAWGAFDGYLAAMPELSVPALEIAPRNVEADLSVRALAAAGVERAARHERAKAPSWEIRKVTGEKVHVPATEIVPADPRGERVVAGMPATPGHRADAGVAWGSLVHGLLEHAVRHREASRSDLERLARWLTVEKTELRPFIPDALDVATEVMATDALRDALASGEAHVEVPFAVRIDPAPAVLRGVIDLVYRATDGWRILDYKTDQIEGLVNVEQLLLARHGPQLEQYRAAWHAATGERVSGAGIVSLRARETFWEKMP